MSNADHVHEDIRALLDGSAEDRLTYIEGDQWVPYGQALEGLELLRKTLAVRDQLSPRGVLLLAESQMGKSAIIEQFRIENPADDNTEGEHIKVPVLVLQFPDSGGEGVYGEICRTLNVKLPSRPTPLELRSEALGIMDDCGVRVLVIDELANVLTGRANAKQRNMNQIKFIMNERRRPVVLGVTPDAHKLIKTDKQIRYRFKRHELHRLNRAQMSLFVQGWIYLQPLRKPSDINDSFVKEVAERTGGHIGTIVLLLRELASKAIQTGQERIDMELLKTIEFIDDSDVGKKRAAAKNTGSRPSAKRTASKKVAKGPEGTKKSGQPLKPSGGGKSGKGDQPPPEEVA